MQRFAALFLLAAATLTVASAQTDKKKFATPNAKSPAAESSVTINGKEIWMVYHAPSVNGRKIFGAKDSLQPEDSLWRGGADWATFLHTDAALDLNGTTLPPGEYTLFIALDKGKWDLIVNSQTGQWGIKRDGSANFDPAKNVAKVPMTMAKEPSPVETLKWTLSSAGNKGTLKLEWENVSASVNFTAK